jgi:hypothetical protein
MDDDGRRATAGARVGEDFRANSVELGPNVVRLGALGPIQDAPGQGPNGRLGRRHDGGARELRGRVVLGVVHEDAVEAARELGREGALAAAVLAGDEEFLAGLELDRRRR